MPDNQRDLVTVHTPDGAAYHPGLNAYGTTIPTSTKDGKSHGFDPHKPGIVIVDPDMEGGDLAVDFSKLAEVKDLNNIIQRTAGDNPDGNAAFEAFSEIAGKVAAAEVQTSSSASLPPVSKKEPSGMNKPKLRMPKATAVVAEVPAVAPSSAPLEKMLAEQASLISQLTSQVAGLQPSEEPAEEPEEEAAATETTSNSLEMDFLGMPIPLKPQKEIYFEMPQAGTMGARYHAVIEGGNCIALVYDTRYEDGYQWIPPALGDTKIKMTVSRDDKTYVCSSLGIHFHIGVLDVVVLFKHDDDE